MAAQNKNPFSSTEALISKAEFEVRVFESVTVETGNDLLAEVIRLKNIIQAMSTCVQEKSS